MAKGLSSGYQPISAISLGTRVATTLLNANEELVHGYTYSGHPVASAIALKNLEVLNATSSCHASSMKSDPICNVVCARHFRSSSGGRGQGHRIARRRLSWCRTKSSALSFLTREPWERNAAIIAFNDGLICRAIRDTMVLAPPLVVSEQEVDEIIIKLKSAIDRTAKDCTIL